MFSIHKFSQCIRSEHCSFLTREEKNSECKEHKVAHLVSVEYLWCQSSRCWQEHHCIMPLAHRTQATAGYLRVGEASDRVPVFLCPVKGGSADGWDLEPGLPPWRSNPAGRCQGPFEIPLSHYSPSGGSHSLLAPRQISPLGYENKRVTPWRSSICARDEDKTSVEKRAATRIRCLFHGGSRGARFRSGGRIYTNFSYSKVY